jgi:signal transduction histidine kinase/CheY-like chemotaxis protein
MKRELASRGADFKRGIEKTYIDDLKQGCKDGTFIWVESTSRLCKNEKTGRVEVYGVTRNVTEKKRLQEEHEKLEQQRNQRQKLESLGILAGGIAHDFNNLMSGIFGYIDLALSVSHNTAVSQYLNNAISAIDRARGLTRQLLTFSKGGAPTQKVQSCIELIRETAQFALSGSAVACTFDLPHDLWLGIYDREQIAQVIDNIVINAQQAMPQGGTIFIIACNLILSENEHAVLPAGNYIKISICDQGIGMAAEIIPHIFDPFFTTKTSGHGMGLSTCYSIVRRHGGVIEVESQPGKGSIFHIYLPAVLQTPEIEEEKVAIKLRGSGMVLVMDDEEIVRDSTADMLRTFGFTVIVASDGKEALEIYRQKTAMGEAFTALILDRTIPGGMGGIEMIRELRKTDIATPVFVSSGYADNPCMIRPADFGFTASIQKPFLQAELAALLREHLGKDSVMRDTPRG